MALGKDTFGLSKTEFNEKIGRIIQNFRSNSKLIGEPREFILRCCRLTEKWAKLANDPDVIVYLRTIDIAGGRRVKMLSLERGGSKQPIPKAKLVDELYPVKKIATTATPEEKHYNAVKAAMRTGIYYQLKGYRDTIELPIVCSITGKKIRPGMRTDVDHIGMPFSEIADKFVESYGLKYTDIILKGPPTGKVFKNEELWKQWVSYHLEHARFSLVCASGNRSKGSDGYQTPPDLIGSFAKESPDDLALDF
jgi:hypothetical protein